MTCYSWYSVIILTGYSIVTTFMMFYIFVEPPKFVEFPKLFFNFLLNPYWDNPKSANFAWPFESNKMLLGFKSLWTILFYRKISNAKIISAM